MGFLTLLASRSLDSFFWNYEVTLGNALIWGGAIAAATFLSAYAILPILVAVSLSITYMLFE